MYHTVNRVHNSSADFADSLLILRRNADEVGLNDWIGLLKSGQINAAEMIYGFIYSEEYIGRKLSSADTVEILYRVMPGRNSDAKGKADWVKVPEDGYSCVKVINGFSKSAEFTNLCKEYGIQPGSVEADPIPEGKRAKIEAFVDRCYSALLGRETDAASLKDWSDAPEKGTASAAEIIDGIVNSAEYAHKKIHARAIGYQALQSNAGPGAGCQGPG